VSATEWERPIDRFKRSTAGTVLSAGLLGLRDALEGPPEREEPAIVSEAPTAPPRGKIEVLIDFERPGHALAIIHVDDDDSLDA
jgi:hypothetical protein